MKKLVSLLIFLSLGTFVMAQNPVKLIIHHKLGASDFSFGTTVQNNLGQSFNLDRTEYYLTKFTVVGDAGTEYPISLDTVALVRAGVPTQINLGNVPVTSIEGINFHVGVHTPENHEDLTLLPSSHPLAPKNPSMHWGWNAGYRFIAMEGLSGTNMNQSLEVHALGDVNYFETAIAQTAEVNNNVYEIHINADYIQAFRGISINQGLISHGETGASVTVCTNFRDHVFTAGTNSLNENQALNVSVFPNPSSGQIQIQTPDNVETSRYEIVDASGAILQVFEVAPNSIHTINMEEKGIYLLRKVGITQSLSFVIQ